MNWEARAKLTAESDQLISKLTEPEMTESLRDFRHAVDALDEVLKASKLDAGTRINAIVGGAARFLLEKNGKP